MAIAGLALATIACLAVVTAGGGRIAAVEENTTYTKWLGGLTADPASSADAGEQVSETANAVLPFSSRIGSLQGKDFVGDAVSCSLAPSSPLTHIASCDLHVVQSPLILLNFLAHGAAHSFRLVKAGCNGRPPR